MIPATAAAAGQRRVRHRPSVIGSLSLLWLIAIIAAGAFAQLLAPYDPEAIDLADRLMPPLLFGGDQAHPLGTDDQGRDLLSRLLHGAQLSLLIAFVGTIASAALGTLLGYLAAHRRGWVDAVVRGLIDLQASMPFFIVAIAVIAFIGNSMIMLMVVVCLYGWERYARVTRALGLSMTAGGFAEAIAAYGARAPWIYWRHILPNSAGVLLVNMILNFPQTILLESTLSFLGLGVQPPQASLGAIMNYGRDHLLTAWWITVVPGVIITATMLAASILGDRLRDRLDPTLR